MGIGVSVLLLAVGAILAFAVNASVSGVDLQVVGWILMAAGLLGLIWSLVLISMRRRDVVVDPRHSVGHVVADPAPTVVQAQPEVAVRHDVVDDPRMG